MSSKTLLDRLGKTNDGLQYEEGLHQMIHPLDVREGDPIKAKVYYNNIWKEMKVWRLSPVGVELVISPEDNDINLNSSIDLHLKIGTSSVDYQGLFVGFKYQVKDKNVIGVRLLYEEQGTGGLIQRRKVKRWNCHEEFCPTGISSNPAFYNDFIYFRIQNISSMGLMLTTSLRNKALIKGMQLNCLVNFPMVGQINIRFKIEYTRIILDDGKEQLAIGASLVGPSRPVLEMIGQYVLQFCDEASVLELKKEGLPIKSSSLAYDFRFVKSKEDYLAVLKLRKLSYQHSGKLPENVQLEDISDFYDASSRILMITHHGKLIGSARLVFVNADETLEHEAYFTWPDYFPSKAETIEVSRLCIHPDYRGNDLFIMICKYTSIVALQAGRYYLMGSADDHLLKYYLKAGAKLTPIKYYHKELNNLEHSVFYGYIPDGITGKSVGPIVWNLLFADLYEYLITQEILTIDLKIKFRIMVYRMLRPLAFLLFRLSGKTKLF